MCEKIQKLVRARIERSLTVEEGIDLELHLHEEGCPKCLEYQDEVLNETFS